MQGGGSVVDSNNLSPHTPQYLIMSCQLPGITPDGQIYTLQIFSSKLGDAVFTEIFQVWGIFLMTEKEGVSKSVLTLL